MTNEAGARRGGFALATAVLALFVLVAAAPRQADAAGPLPVKVVVVAMFELGKDTANSAGELQRWVNEYPLPETFPFPASGWNLRYNPDRQVLGVVTGVGASRAATAITALGLDPRFDLSHAYWLVAGIAGANPDVMSLGSAAWAEWIVDGDLAHEIDGRELPSDWPTGYVPLGQTTPYEEPRSADTDGLVYHLNPALADWAFRLTRDVALQDTEAMQTLRAHYTGHPAALLPPSVIKGDILSASTFWHGKLFNDWAARWMAYWTDGTATFATAAMEDAGTMRALTALGAMGRIDRDRVLVLRTASNYSMQYEGISAAESLAHEAVNFSAFKLSVDAAYTVGRVVVDALVDGWDTYGETAPGSE